MSNIKQLKENNVPIYPITHENSVIDNDGVSISNKVNNLRNEKAEKVHRHNYSDIDNTPNIINNLTSTSTNSSLSANQGKVLNDTKVDKIPGKGLSTNDFTNEYKTKVETSATKIAEIENNLTIVNETVEGSQVSINNTLEAYLQNIEIKGNTIQNPNDLSDIKSVGDKIGDQELYKIPIVCCGANINSTNLIRGNCNTNTGVSESGGMTILITSDFLKVPENTTFSYDTNGIKIRNIITFSYDADKKYIGYENTIKSKPGAKFIKVRFTKYDRTEFTDKEVNDIRLSINVGEQSIPYEDYKEHKITILSPTPIEKVGDVDDRIIEKDGVWGVEKNNIDIVLNGNTSINVSQPENQINALCDRFMTDEILLDGQTVITDKLGYNNGSYDSEGLRAIGTRVYIYIQKEIYGGVVGQYPNLSKFKAWLKDNNINIKIPTTKPQFIPLPNSQQIKLKTFANKTNISFLTEVEGTIKADVAKSISASVNSNTQEISKINNRILDLEGLKESQEMSYETDKGYLVCKETKVGTVKDMKIYGKSLLNKIGKFNSLRWVNNESGTIVYYDEVIPTSTLEVGKTYTLIAYGFGKAVDPTRCVITDMNKSSMIYGNDYIFKFTVNSFTNPGIIHFYNGIGDPITEADYVNAKILLLEGDHTQSPPNGYFEGIASVGTGVDKIEISSCSKIDYTYSNSYGSRNDYTLLNALLTGCNIINKSDKSIVAQVYSSNTQKWIRDDNVSPNENYIIKEGEYCPIITLYTSRGWQLKEEKLERFIFISTQNQDKKPLLFKDTDGTWKPITELRGLPTSCDTVELHSDGKYYYHIRTEKEVLNGTRNWSNNGETSKTYSFICNDIIGSTNQYNIISDKVITGSGDTEHIRLGLGSGKLILTLDASKLESYSVASLKKWLQSNSITVVYELSQEKVYEVNSLFLEVYENETMIVTNSGAINPSLEFKITSYITNLISNNTKRIKQIENDFYNYVISQNKMMLVSRYSADLSSFKVDVSSVAYKTEDYDTDLYNLIKNIILVGKENYDKLWIEECITFYWMDFVISDEMYTDLTNIIESQHLDQSEQNEPIII